MRCAVKTAVFDASAEDVWEVVTNNGDIGWRSDIIRVECHEKTFVEYTKQGMATKFCITQKEPCRYYALTLENQWIVGNWYGEFSKSPAGTCLKLVERVQMKQKWLSWLIFFMPLRTMRKRYVKDLRRKLMQDG